VKIAILGRLRCPICVGCLSLHPIVSADSELAKGSVAIRTKPELSVVEEALLLCSHCRVWYPVYSYVPVLLVFPTPLHRMFARRHESQIRALGDYHAPDGHPEPGEGSIQETFTDEWNCVQESSLSFHYSTEELQQLNRRVWLTWLDGDRHQINAMLDVGCGLGLESIALQAVTGANELFAVDLNFAVLQSGKLFRDRSDIHLVIASLFHLPFERASFDMVYSQGVLHHTYSTSKAFSSITNYVRNNGYVFVWVYGLDDHLVRHGIAGIATRIIFLAENVLRPGISRMPRTLRNAFFTVLSLMLHPVVKWRYHKTNWTLSNTNHDLRDRLSPRYARRHSYNEVLEWFEAHQLQVVCLQNPGMYRQLFGKCLWGVGVSGRKVESAQRC
jgi:SAM-dependent methyltransferase/uncharacterized protein YbaR (Trm112 family)